jgi:hypothetical protein
VKGVPENNRFDFSGTAVGNFPVPSADSVVVDQISKTTESICTMTRLNFSRTLQDVLNSDSATFDVSSRIAGVIADYEATKSDVVQLQDKLDELVLSAYRVNQGGPDIYSRILSSPMYKRQWRGRQGVYGSAATTVDERLKATIGDWLLTRLETYFHDADRMVSGEDEAATAAKLAHIRPLRARFAGGGEPRLVSVSQLAQTAQADSQWMEAATVFAGRADFAVAKLVETLVLAESVPVLPAQRYKPVGLRKREEWEKTWDLQRAEDAVEEEVRGQNPGVNEEELKKKIRKAQLEAVGDIPVPPKYGDKDFIKSSYWKLRGKLDVPKERWVLYPGMEGGHDTSPVIAWAGWDHAQQAQALTGFYQQATDTWGWEPQKLAPLLAALKELLPWLHQWHNAIDPAYGDRISTTYQQFYETELHTLRLTDEDIEKIRMGATR